MSHHPLERVESLLAEALERPTPERSAFLDVACRDDPALRREVEELLHLQDEAAEYFEELTSDIVGSAGLEVESAARPRIRIGPYRILEAIGRGGMGAVYKAERIDGAFDQKVALKLLHLDMDTPEMQARFLAERQLLARLAHPNIARLQDGGVTEEGRPYFVMELVDGQPITRYCRERGLAVREALRLFLAVVAAVSYLHRNLIVHRDLKPSNILIDSEGRVKLLDFGIAKLLAESPEWQPHTRTGEVLMTPGYAAPEQVQGSSVTTATDVYALGVILYELLTGERPRGAAGVGPSDPPATPSAALGARDAERNASAEGRSRRGAARRRIARDLNHICLKALRPEADARYSSAEQLGQDVERYLQGLPVLARKGTFWYRLGKHARRHVRAATVAVSTALLLVGGFARERSLRDEAQRAEVEAQRQAARAVAVSGFLAELLSSVDPSKAQGNEVTVAEVLDDAAARLESGTELTRQPSVEAAVRQAIGNTYLSLGKYPEARSHLERAVELLGGTEARAPEALSAIADLGVLYGRLGLHNRGERLLRRVLDVRSEILGEDHPDTLAALNRLATLLFLAGRFDEVEPLDRKTLEIRRRVLGEDHADTLRSMNGLAATLFTAGRYGEAATLFEEAAGIQRRQLGENHPDTLMLENNLAATYLELSRYRDAELLLRRVAQGRTKVLGAEHLDTAMTIHNLGMVLAQQGRLEEAERQIEKAITIRQRAAGGEKAALFSVSHLADIYREQERHRESEALYLEVLRQQRKDYGARDEDTLRTTMGLAALRIEQRKLAEAESLLAEIRESLVEVLGEAHPDTLQCLTLLARIRNKQGRSAEAADLGENVMEIGGRTLGPDHRVVLDAAFERARAFAGIGHAEASRELALRIVRGRTRILGESHPHTVEAAHLLREVGGDPTERPARE